MDFIEDIGISEECAQTRFGAEVDRPATILDAREIGRISVAKFSPTEGDEARVFFLFRRLFRHLKNHHIQAARDGGLRARKIIELQR